MSFLTRTVPRQFIALGRARLFTTTPHAQKSASEAAKDTVGTVNRTVSDAAVKGIEKGEKATETLKSTLGVNASKAEGSAKEASGEVKGKAQEVAGKAENLAGQAKGKAHEVAGEAKGKKEEVKSKI